MLFTFARRTRLIEITSRYNFVYVYTIHPSSCRPDRDLPTLGSGGRKHESANMRMMPKQLIELRHASLAPPRICRGKSDASF